MNDSTVILPLLALIVCLYLAPKLYSWIKPRIAWVKLLHKTIGEENLDATDAVKKYALGMEIDEKDYGETVGHLLSTLTEDKQQWVYDQEDRYQATELTLLYRMHDGVRMGLKDAPLLEDESIPVRRHDDGSIDWSDTNIISPILQEVKTIDYAKMYEVIMEAIEKDE